MKYVKEITTKEIDFKLTFLKLSRLHLITKFFLKYDGQFSLCGVSNCSLGEVEKEQFILRTTPVHSTYPTWDPTRLCKLIKIYFHP